MTQNEFYEFWKHTTAAFPAVHKLFDGGTESKDRSRIWQAALTGVKLQHATEAIDAMVRGEAECPRYDWAELPKFVVRYCADRCNAELASTRRNYYGDSTAGAVKCLHCCDSYSGFVAIWNPGFLGDCDQQILECQSIRDVVMLFSEWRRSSAERRYMTFVVVCSCDSPNAKGKREKGAERIFKANKMLPVCALPGLHEYLRDTKRLEWDPDY